MRDVVHIISRIPSFRQFRRENLCKESGTEQSRQGERRVPESHQRLVLGVVQLVNTCKRFQWTCRRRAHRRLPTYLCSPFI